MVINDGHHVRITPEPGWWPRSLPTSIPTQSGSLTPVISTRPLEHCMFAEITPHPGAAGGLPPSSATGIAVRSAMRRNSISRISGAIARYQGPSAHTQVDRAVAVTADTTQSTSACPPSAPLRRRHVPVPSACSEPRLADRLHPARLAAAARPRRRPGLQG